MRLPRTIIRYRCRVLENRHPEALRRLRMRLRRRSIEAGHVPHFQSPGVVEFRLQPIAPVLRLVAVRAVRELIQQMKISATPPPRAEAFNSMTICKRLRFGNPSRKEMAAGGSARLPEPLRRLQIHRNKLADALLPHRTLSIAGKMDTHAARFDNP